MAEPDAPPAPRREERFDQILRTTGKVIALVLAATGVSVGALDVQRWEEQYRAQEVEDHTAEVRQREDLLKLQDQLAHFSLPQLRTLEGNVRFFEQVAEGAPDGAHPPVRPCVCVDKGSKGHHAAYCGVECDERQRLTCEQQFPSKECFAIDEERGALTQGTP